MKQLRHDDGCPDAGASVVCIEVVVVVTGGTVLLEL